MEKQRVPVNRVPHIDRSDCTDCESCIDLHPQIFRRNKETGCIEVAELSEYPEEAVQEVMAMCPGDCITWQES